MHWRWPGDILPHRSGLIVVLDGVISRRAERHDVPAIKELTHAAYAHWVDVIGRKPLPMTADYEAAVENHLIQLVCDDAQLIGMIEMCVEPDGLLIENIAVMPGHQGHGLGTTLLRHAEKQATQLGLTRLRLYTNQKFQSNIDFYARFGFEIERTERFMDGWTVYMGKSLKKDS